MKQEMKHIGFQAPVTMEGRLRERAEVLGISKSALIKIVLADWLKEQV